MNTFRASIASHESGLPPGHLSMPGKKDGFVVTPEDRVPELDPQACVGNIPG